MKLLMLSLAAAGVLVYVGMGAMLYLQQRSHLYFPTPPWTGALESRYVTATDGTKLEMWIVNPGRERAILYFGGNAEQIEQNAIAYQRFLGAYTIYLGNYRGYGRSEGVPTEEVLLGDALHLYDTLSGGHTSVSVIGRSLGSGVATYLAAHRSVERLALLTPYDSIERVAQQAYPIFPVSLLLHDKFRSIDWAGALKLPILVVMVEDDLVVPNRSTQRLINALDSTLLEVTRVAGVDHGSVSDDPSYQRALGHYFRFDEKKFGDRDSN
jgi:pimeloyl-ACP methyl ester carboxylesterase